jgi:putative membrane protein
MHMHHHILQQFGLTSAAFLGNGSESYVYALDTERVLRIYPPGTNLEYLAARHSFYHQLAEQQPNFTIPQLLEQGVCDQHPYTIEVCMQGHAFAHMLPHLSGADRLRALTSYLDLAASIGTIRFPDAAYGELIDLKRLQHASWPAYLADRIQQNLAISRSDLMQDVPQFEAVYAAFSHVLESFEPTPAKCLVHGDYFPGNVFIDDSGRVYGVGDFGYSTLVGDAHMDIAGAIIFIELVEGYQPGDTQVLLQYLESQPQRAALASIDLYRLYYSFYFGHCKESDPATYNWCVRNLNRYRLDG